jgi:hypothetical protein
MVYRPGLGSIVTHENPWLGVNILSDVFEVKFGFGKAQVRGEIPYGFSFTEFVDTEEFGTQFSVGVNFPLNILTLGAQKSPLMIFRGHPTLAYEMGTFRFHNVNKYFGDPQSSIYYLGLNPGYRLKLPYGSVEFNFNMRLGLTTGEDDYHKGVGVYPSVTFRLDALKWKYNPKMVSVVASQTTLSNVQTKTKRTGTRYNSDGSRVEYYTKTTTATVSVKRMNVGVQDIGPHIGLGPKLTLMNPRRTPFSNPSYLAGITLEGRGGPFDYGLTLEGGRVGHGSELESKDVDEGKYRKKLDKRETFGTGSINTVNFYLSLGIDISPIFLVPLGISMDKGDATSFLSVTSGFLLGAHGSWGQTFNNAFSNQTFDQILQQDQHNTDEKFLDPRAAGGGFLSGFYIATQVGAVSFRITNYRYYGAPFASNTLLSLAYRFPLKTDK